MKTRCSSCQTIFRVTSEQLRARAGRVRCGQCRTVFNALDGLLDDEASFETAGRIAPVERCESAVAPPSPATRSRPQEPQEPLRASVPADMIASEPNVSAPADSAQELPLGSPSETTPDALDIVADVDKRNPGHDLQESTDGDRWLGGSTSRGALALDSPAARPFAIAAVLLALLLVGQLVFHFRTDIAISVPLLQPPLAMLSDVLGTDVPLPRRVEMLSIEASDLQVDQERKQLLALQVTLRNRATYAQAYPVLELTLTDTNDRIVARRLLLPDEYLSAAALAEQAFPASADVDVRLWIETREIAAAGYRLYLFYP
jgi:predicted Zn finger-like uncharacterized protein